MGKRVFENPHIKDKVTVLESAEDTDGEYLLLEIEMLAGGGNSWHYHTSFDEEFTAVEGVLGIGLNKRNIYLQPGETAIARKGELHRFFNPGNTTVRFHVKIAPGKIGFLYSLSIGYGLAADGLTNKNGIPKKLDHLACLLDLSDTRLPGFLSLITPMLLRRAVRVRERGVEKQLLQRYWK
ncbi:MAG: cupin domain-containing protein [Chitinophagaceae bacterium]